MAFGNGFTLSAALLLAVLSVVCIFWTTPHLHRSTGLTALESAQSTGVTAFAFSKGHATSALPQRAQSLSLALKAKAAPVRTATVLREPELSSVARMTNLQSEGDLSPTTQNEIDIIENNMNFLRDSMDKVSDQLAAEHDFMQVTFLPLAVLNMSLLVIDFARFVMASL
jgi:hypothetical protein